MRIDIVLYGIASFDRFKPHHGIDDGLGIALKQRSSCQIASMLTNAFGVILLVWT